MIRRFNERKTVHNTNMRGGHGTVTVQSALEPDQGELHGKGRLFSTITVPPGASVGGHKHEGEMEAYLIISGQARYNDDGAEVMLYPGDVTYTAPGQSHSIANAGDGDLVLAALILFE
jgi:mannose-6-phosphate isomerase-like protein (cupin superfamily)